MTAPAGDPFNALGDTHRRQIVELLGGRVQAYLDQVWGDAAGRFRMFAQNTGEDDS